MEICQKCCGKIRQTKLQKSVELLFLERRHPPGPRWPVKTNIVFVIFSVNISYSNILHNLYILPKLFITLCCVALDTLLSVLCHFQQVTDVTNNSLMPVNACFTCLRCCYLYICLEIEERLHVPERYLSIMSRSFFAFYSRQSLCSYTCSKHIVYQWPNAVMGKWNIDTKDSDMLLFLLFFWI